MKPVLFAATANPGASLEFYQSTLGLKLLEESPFALVFDVAGVPLRVQKVEQVNPPPYTTLGFSVPDIVNEVQALQNNNVEFERYPFIEQDALGIWTTPDGARIAWFKDPDGNLLSLSQSPA